MTKQKNLAFYHIAAVLIVGVWGLTFISTKTLINHGFSPSEIFVLRFIIAYAGIWIISPKKLFCDSLMDELKLVLLGVTGGSFYFWTENTALQFSQASNVSFIVCTTPLLTSLLALLVKRVGRGSVSRHLNDIKMTPYLAVGSVLAFIGMAMVIFNGQFILKLNPIGDSLALLASLSWAVYSLVMNDISTRYDTRFATRKVFFYGLLTILPVFIFRPWNVPMEVFKEPSVIFNLLFLSVIASLVCFVCWNPVMKNLGVVKASNYIYLNPMFTLIGALIVLGEKITWLSGFGSAIILLGVWVAGQSGRKE